MGQLLNGSGASQWSLALLAVLVDLAVKGLAVLAIAYVLTLLLRRASAATRHLVWSVALAGLLALPILSLALPRWNLPILPSAELAAGPAGAPAVEIGARAAEPPAPAADAGISVSVPVSPETFEPAPMPAAVSEEAPAIAPATPGPLKQSLHWSAWILIGWGSGAAVVLGVILIGTARVWRLARSARPVEGSSPWGLLWDGVRERFRGAGRAFSFPS